jgi:hypothetical protein
MYTNCNYPTQAARKDERLVSVIDIKDAWASMPPDYAEFTPLDSPPYTIPRHW